MRIEAPDYHAAAAVAPEVATEVGRLQASHRIAGPRGLQGIAGDPPPPRAQSSSDTGGIPPAASYGAFFDRNQISFKWLNADDADVAEAWGGPLPLKRTTGLSFALSTGRPWCDRSFGRLPRLLRLGTEPLAAEYDVVVVGAGPAGLAAAVYGASEGLRTMRGRAGGSRRSSWHVVAHRELPRVPVGVSGDELARRALPPAQRLGAEILVTRSIARIDPRTRHVYLDGGDVLRTKTIILACGVSWRQLSVEGFDTLVGKGIHSGGPERGSEHPRSRRPRRQFRQFSRSFALFFSSHVCRSVTMLWPGDSLDKSKGSGCARYLADQLELKWDHEGAVPDGGRGRSFAGSIRSRRSTCATFRDGGRDAARDRVACSSSSGRTPRRPGYRQEIALDDAGYVLTGPERPPGERQLAARTRSLPSEETSVPGILA